MGGVSALENWGPNLCISVCQAWDARLEGCVVDEELPTSSLPSGACSLLREAKGHLQDQRRAQW